LYHFFVCSAMNFDRSMKLVEKSLLACFDGLLFRSIKPCNGLRGRDIRNYPSNVGRYGRLPPL
jgi:hypothetical protein